MSIQAVFFDMGGTIETYGWTPELRIRETEGLQQLLVKAGIVLGLTNEQLYETISAGLDRYHQVSLQTMDEIPPERVWNEYILAGCPGNWKICAAVAEDLMFFIETHYFQRAMRPEIPGVLEAVQKMGLKIGLISNVNSRSQVPFNLDLYGIRRFFDPIILSSEYGRRKPDPAIFHYAARLAKVPTGECVYIGDRVSRDIVGARKAGFKLAVQIRHDFEHGEDDSGASPDAVIDRMTEILDILQNELRNSHADPANKSSENQVRALLFDAGDVLYHRQDDGVKLAAFLKKVGVPDREFPIDRRTALRDQAYQGLIDYDHYQETILRFYGVSRPEELALGKKVLDEEANNVQFFEGVAETLCSLKEAGFLLGVITDTALPVYVKLAWFERAGFGDVWDSIISSRELRIRKPDPKIYRVSLQQLRVSASQAIFVGHKSSELDGAKTIGMGTIAFNYDKDARADYYIERFSDLLTVPIVEQSVPALVK
jgi:putative hydrolase of the HAD superfamily